MSAAVEAALDRRAAKRQASAHLQRQNVEIWRMGHEPQPGQDRPMSAADVTLTLRAALLARGLSADEVDKLGLGYHTVQKIIKGKRPPDS